MSINKEPNVFLNFFLSMRFMTYAPSFILGKLSFEPKAIKPGFLTETLSNLDIT